MSTVCRTQVQSTAFVVAVGNSVRPSPVISKMRREVLNSSKRFSVYMTVDDRIEFRVYIDSGKLTYFIGKMLVPLGWYPSCLTPQGAL